MTSGRLSG
jgi:hypothetical protein